jgi:hypothetical protein
MCVVFILDTFNTEERLSKTIENLIDVSSNEADRIIAKLIKARKLLQTPRAASEKDDTLILG